MPTGVYRYGKLWKDLSEKIHVLDKLYPDTPESAVGYKLDVNESTISIKQGVFKQKAR